MGLLTGKKGVVFKAFNSKSIGWGVAKEATLQGAEVAIVYMGEVGEKRIVPLAKEHGVTMAIQCDINNQEDLDNLYNTLEKKWGKIDFVVHSMGSSDKNELRGRFIDTSEQNFLNTMNAACYSLIKLAKKFEPLLDKANGGSIIAMSYYGAEKVIPNYNIMGVAKAALEATVRYLAVDMGTRNIRVNAMSSGPIKTIAASGIGNFNYMLKYCELNTPMKRNVTLEDNGKTAVYLLSDMSSSVNGEVIHIDGGYHVVGMKDPRTENLEIPKNLLSRDK